MWNTPYYNSTKQRVLVFNGLSMSENRLSGAIMTAKSAIIGIFFIGTKNTVKIWFFNPHKDLFWNLEEWGEFLVISTMSSQLELSSIPRHCNDQEIILFTYSIVLGLFDVNPLPILHASYII